MQLMVALHLLGRKEGQNNNFLVRRPKISIKPPSEKNKLAVL